VVADITAAGGSALAIAADISSRAEYQAMVGRLLDEYGRWDMLVNNAAVAVTKPFPEISEEEFDRSFAVNVKGVFHGLQLAWEHLADGGRIITISSSTTALMLPGYAVYDATKGAFEQFTPRSWPRSSGRMGLADGRALIAIRLDRSTDSTASEYPRTAQVAESAHCIRRGASTPTRALSCTWPSTAKCCPKRRA
jgi:short chain dehydrogenase